MAKKTRPFFKRRKYLRYFILLVALGMVIFMLIYISNKQGELSRSTGIDEKQASAYSNELFSFKYPHDWVLKSADGGKIILAKTVMGVDESGAKQPITSELRINYQKVPDNMTLNTWMKNRVLSGTGRLDEGQNDAILKLLKTTTLGGEEASYFIMPGAGNYNGDGIVSIHHGYGYDIRVEGNISDEDDLQMVISTFEFK